MELEQWIRVRISEADLASLSAGCKQHGVSLSEAVRRGAQLYLQALTLTKQPPVTRGGNMRKYDSIRAKQRAAEYRQRRAARPRFCSNCDSPL